MLTLTSLALDATQLRALMLARGWSVGDLALVAGASPRTVEGWLQGRPVGLRSLILISSNLEGLTSV